MLKPKYQPTYDEGPLGTFTLAMDKIKVRAEALAQQGGLAKNLDLAKAFCTPS